MKNPFEAAEKLFEIQAELKEIKQRYPELYYGFEEKMFGSTDDAALSLSNRDRVRKAGEGVMLDIDDLASKSGLSKKQVRGVINAPGEKDNWAREEDPLGNGLEKIYGYRPESK